MRDSPVRYISIWNIDFWFWKILIKYRLEFGISNRAIVGEIKGYRRRKGKGKNWGFIINMRKILYWLQVCITSPRLSTIPIFHPLSPPPPLSRGWGRILPNSYSRFSDIFIFALSDPGRVIWWAFSTSFATRWIVGQDGEQGKVIFPESFNGVIATEVNNLDLHWKPLINLMPIMSSACHNWNTWALWSTSCWERLQSNCRA